MRDNNKLLSLKSKKLLIGQNGHNADMGLDHKGFFPSTGGKALHPKLFIYRPNIHCIKYGSYFIFKAFNLLYLSSSPISLFYFLFVFYSIFYYLFFSVCLFVWTQIAWFGHKLNKT